MALSIAAPLCCLLLVAVAIVLCMATGASAQLTPYCFTRNSAVISDALQAFSHLRLQGKDKICQANCEGDHACTVVDEHQTAQLKLCGGCNVCVEYCIADYLFSAVFHVCGLDTGDGIYPISGKLGHEDYEVVIDGKKQNVDADNDIKLSK